MDCECWNVWCACSGRLDYTYLGSRSRGESQNFRIQLVKLKKLFVLFENNLKIFSQVGYELLAVMAIMDF